MIIGVVTDNGETVTAYSEREKVRRYVYEDGELTKLPVWHGMDSEIRKLHLKDDPFSDSTSSTLSVLICGEIGEGTAAALEEMGVKIFRNVAGGVAEALEDLKNDRLEEGENAERSDAQNLLDYSRTIWLKPQKVMDEINQKALARFGASLDEKDKAWLFDRWFEDRDSWWIFSDYAELMNIKFDLKTAVKYLNGFLQEHDFGKWRKEDYLYNQEILLEYLQLLLKHVENGCEQEFLSESLITAAKNRLIFVAEFLMDQKADINYVNQKGESVETYEKKMKDLTMASYLAYYRENGKKKSESRVFFEGDETDRWKIIYTPEIVAPKKAPSKNLFGKAALRSAKSTLRSYGKPDLLDESTASVVLSRFVNEYNWDDGLEVPYFIAHHPNCSKALKKKLFKLAEGDMYGTKDFENSDDEAWKKLLTDLYDMLHEKR